MREPSVFLSSGIITVWWGFLFGVGIYEGNGFPSFLSLKFSLNLIIEEAKGLGSRYSCILLNDSQAIRIDSVFSFIYVSIKFYSSF
jgi:hypothetical protein